jgi:hypothetical protein
VELTMQDEASMRAPRVKRAQRLYPSPRPGGDWGFAA